MRLLTTGSEISRELIRLCRDSETISMAVAWGTPNSVFHEFLEQKAKWRHVVVGTHFYQTPPIFLEKFVGVQAARAMLPDGGTFHPKVYKFTKGRICTLVVGSANFTHSAFKINVEVCVVLEGDIYEPAFKDAEQFIANTCWQRARVVDRKFLKNYTAAFKQNRDKLESRDSNEAGQSVLPNAPTDVPQMEWAQYAQAVINGNFYADRILMLGKAREVLAQGTFAELSDKHRKAIAGTVIRIGDEIVWTLFGSMMGFGILKNIVAETPQDLSDALDCIPMIGRVNGKHYENFIVRYRAAFEERQRVGDIASASRFLAMKRPDVFVCVSTKNRPGLKTCFMEGAEITIENYWTGLIAAIRNTAWWNSARPNDQTALIWDGRAALLDGVFYQERKSNRR